MFKNNQRQVFATKMNVIDRQKTKEEVILSIQKNMHCLDLLENIQKKYEDNFKFTKNREDEILVEQVKWITFQIQYNVDLFYKSLKKLGGKVSDVKPFKWE